MVDGVMADGGAPAVTAHQEAFALGPRDVGALPWEPLRGMGDVRHKVLWRSGDSVAGLLRVEPGASEVGHTHTTAHHHAWVLEGSARVAGIPVEKGAYVHVPAGVRHAITDTGPDGCTLFYLFQTHTR